MDTKMQKEIRFLKFYAGLMTVVVGFLIFFAFKFQTEKTNFDEINVERLNIVEKDGTLRLAISNRDRSPGPVIGGLYMKTREGQRPGMIFFNDKGDECGGLTWGSREEDGRIRANAGLMFDQYNQDQTVGIVYSQVDENRHSGLMVWERPLTPLADFARKLSEIESMADGPEKTEAVMELRKQAAESGITGALRIFLGRGQENEAVLKLADTNGKTRILIGVDGNNIPSIQFLNEEGEVIYKLPPDGSSR